jgi:hypothetical protein
MLSARTLRVGHNVRFLIQRAGVSQREAIELMRHGDPRLTAKTYADATVLPLRSAVQKLICPASQASQGVSQILTTTCHLPSTPVTEFKSEKMVKPIENKRGKVTVSGRIACDFTNREMVRDTGFEPVTPTVSR